MVVLNNDIIQETDSELDLANAFHKSHLMLAENCEVFYNILYKPSYISLTLEDYYSTLRNSTVTIIASGYSAGEKRVLTAFDEAVKSPLFKPYKIDEMDGIICAFQCSTKHQIQMEEVEYIHEIMRTRIKEGSNFIWLADFNEEMNEEVKVTLIASIKNNK